MLHVAGVLTEAGSVSLLSGAVTTTRTAGTTATRRAATGHIGDNDDNDYNAMMTMMTNTMMTMIIDNDVILCRTVSCPAEEGKFLCSNGLCTQV